MKQYKVAGWGVGGVGSEMMASVVESPDLDLVGLRVYSENKDGRDIGELIGIEPLGVTATRDVEKFLALDADCVCYAATNWYGHEQVVEDMCQILRSGKNIVDVTLTSLAYPDLMPESAEAIRQACEAGGTTFYYGGINPGFAIDLLPALVASGSRQIESVELTEYFDMSTYLDAPVMEHFGFGLTEQEYHEKVQLQTMADFWSPSARLVAKAIAGVELEEMRIVTTDLRLADHAYDVAAIRIEAGTVESFHIGLEFLVRGVPRIIYHEYMRVTPDVTAPWQPDWPPPPGGVSGYRVKVNGTPTVVVDLSFDPSGPDTERWRAIDACGGAVMFTAARLVNAIPAVCEAAPGMYTTISLHDAVLGSAQW